MSGEYASMQASISGASTVRAMTFDWLHMCCILDVCLAGISRVHAVGSDKHRQYGLVKRCNKPGNGCGSCGKQLASKHGCTAALEKAACAKLGGPVRTSLWQCVIDRSNDCERSEPCVFCYVVFPWCHKLARRIEGACITARCSGVISFTNSGYSTVPVIVP